MTWIFGSFLVTPCALTSCHVVISKQGRVSGKLGPASVYPEGDHVMRTTRSDLHIAENQDSSQGHAADLRRLGPL